MVICSTVVKVCKTDTHTHTLLIPTPPPPTPRLQSVKPPSIFSRPSCGSFIFPSSSAADPQLSVQPVMCVWVTAGPPAAHTTNTPVNLMYSITEEFLKEMWSLIERLSSVSLCHLLFYILAFRSLGCKQQQQQQKNTNVCKCLQMSNCTDLRPPITHCASIFKSGLIISHLSPLCCSSVTNIYCIKNILKKTTQLRLTIWHNQFLCTRVSDYRRSTL